MDKQLNELMQNSLKNDYFGCLVADQHGLCLGVKGVASRRSSGIITAIMNEVKKLEPFSSPPIVVIENDEHKCLINQNNSITTALYKNKKTMCSKGCDNKQLISDEIAIIQNDWKIIMEKKENGPLLFLKFFKKYPHNQQKFKKLAKLTLDELSTSKVLLAHSLKVMYTISSIIDNLDQFETATEILKSIGESHRKNNIQKQSYDELKECVIELLKDNIASFNTEHDVIWNQILTSAFQIITDQL